MKNLFIISAIVLGQGVFAQEVIYFDKDWKVIKDKKNAEFYRETSKQGEYYLIKDFYINGTLQMEGLAIDTKPNAEVFQGKVVWYFPNGKVHMISNYDKGVQTQEHKYYNEKGQIVNDFIYKDGEILKGKGYIYKDEYSNTNMITEYDNSNISKTIVYDKSLSGIRYEEVYYEGYELKEAKYYGEGGKFLGSYKLDKGSYVGTGVKVDYYYDPMQVSCITTYKKGVTNYNDAKCYYGNGKLKKEIINKGKTAIEIVYDEDGKKLGTMEYRYDSASDFYTPYHGTSINISNTERNKKIHSISQYKNGKYTDVKTNDEEGNLEQHIFYEDYEMTKEILSYKDGKQIGKLVYKDNMPYDGELYSKQYQNRYKNGKLMLDIQKDLEGNNIAYEKIFNESKNQYDVKVFKDNKPKYFYTMKINDDEILQKFTGEIIPYDEKGKQLSKVIIKDGVIEKSKLKLSSYEGVIEYSKKGKWVVKKTYNDKKEFIKEEKYKIGDTESYLYEIYEEMLKDNHNDYTEPIPVEPEPAYK